MNRSISTVVIVTSLGLTTAFFALAIHHGRALGTLAAADTKIAHSMGFPDQQPKDCPTLMRDRRALAARTSTPVSALVQAEITKSAHKLGCIDRGDALRLLSEDREHFASRLDAVTDRYWATHAMARLTRTQPLDEYARDHRIFQLDL